ncbi:hypothetical protein CBR_g2739 [Chara braunii]|uniref:Uncharacterized protein n=1 Tax=Chara braunii TaxID=69332 RepID=A0A388KDV1_CHABU|nr:hypothetical protein CBR_g2739 [Chara braunii]|eukprot:GBG68186.1 hypothetical protein CBR_g2739 [Chara braunii]
MVYRAALFDDITLNSNIFEVLNPLFCGSLQELMAKAQEAESVLEEVTRLKKAEVARKAVERQLAAEEKRSKAESMRRIHAFKRKMMLERIKEETGRARAVLEARAALQERRKQANVESSIQRQRLMQEMERFQITKKWPVSSSFSVFGSSSSPGSPTQDQRTEQFSSAPVSPGSNRKGSASRLLSHDKSIPLFSSYS